MRIRRESNSLSRSNTHDVEHVFEGKIAYEIHFFVYLQNTTDRIVLGIVCFVRTFVTVRHYDVDRIARGNFSGGLAR